MNKLTFKISSLSILVVDVVIAILFTISMLITTIKIDLLYKIQFILLIVAVSVNICYLIYIVFNLVRNLIKQKQSEGKR